jgi:putative MFS transporter
MSEYIAMSASSTGAHVPENSDSSSAAVIARIERLPLLPFHLRLIILLGSGLLLDGLDTLIISVILPPVTTAFHVNPAGGGILIAAGFAGQALGALIFGYCSERFGRKIPLVIALSIGGLLSVAAAFSSTYQMLLVLRMIQGIGLGACPPLATALFNEYIPSRQRGRGSLLVQVFFSVGYILSPFLALLVFAFTGPAVGWRLLLALGALPVVIAPLVGLFIPESARWLVLKRRTGEAERIVTNLETRAAQLNRPLLAEDAVEVPAQVSQQQTRLSELFSPRYRRRTLLTWVQWFSSFFVLVGFSSWLPSLYINPGGLTQQQSLILTVCFGVGTLSMLALNAITSDWIGRRRWFIIGFGLATLGAASGALLLGPLHLVSWITLALAGILMSLGAYVCVSGIYVYTSELYPTRIRSWALSTGRSWSCVASIIAPILIGVLVTRHISIAVVFLILSAISLLGLLTVLWLGEETKLRVLENIAR